MGNPFLERVSKKGKSGHGKLSEKRLAKSLGARLRPNSGAMKGAKGDMARRRFLFEAKSTTMATMPVQYHWLVKITHEALGAGQEPAMLISFVTPEGRPVPFAADWVLLPRATFDAMEER